MESWTQADEQEFQRMTAKRSKFKNHQLLLDVIGSAGIPACYIPNIINHAEALRFALAPYDPTAPKVSED